MYASNDYSPHLEHLTLEEIVERDVDGLADEQERAYLRSEQNLTAWRTALGSLNTAMDKKLALRKRLLVRGETRYDNHPDNPEVENAYLREKKGYEEEKERVKQRKEIVQQRLEENGELRQRRHERLMAGPNHRDLLIKARSFLATDQAIAYSYIPERDALLAEIDRGLYGQDEEEANE